MNIETSNGKFKNVNIDYDKIHKNNDMIEFYIRELDYNDVIGILELTKEELIQLIYHGSKLLGLK